MNITRYSEFKCLRHYSKGLQLNCLFQTTVNWKHSSYKKNGHCFQNSSSLRSCVRINHIVRNQLVSYKRKENQPTDHQIEIHLCLKQKMAWSYVHVQSHLFPIQMSTNFSSTMENHNVYTIHIILWKKNKHIPPQQSYFHALKITRVSCCFLLLLLWVYCVFTDFTKLCHVTPSSWIFYAWFMSPAWTLRDFTTGVCTH